MGQSIGDKSSREGARPLDRRRFVQTTGAMAAIGMAGCLGTGDDDDDDDNDDDTDSTADELVIGSNHPLTGPIAFTGTRMDQAVELAATIKNEAGGIESLDGAEVTVISGDNQGQQELGSEVAQELVDDGADVLTGCFSSPVTDDATRVAESEGIPFVISSAVDASILQESPLEYVYRPQPSSDRMAADHAEMLTDILAEHDRSIDTAGLFYLDNSYGQSIRDGLREALPDNGVEVVEEAPISFGQTAETHVTQFRDSDPDIIIATTFEDQTAELHRAMAEQDYEPPLMGGVANAAYANPTELADIGESTNGTLSTGYAVDRTDEDSVDILERFQEDYGEPMDENVGMAFAATQVIIAAVEAAGSTDPDAINEALMDIEVSDHIMAMPPITFGEDGENEAALAPLQQVQDLEPHIVRPDKFAQRDVIL